MDLDFYVDEHAAPELATEITKLAERYIAAVTKGDAASSVHNVMSCDT